MTGQPAKHKYNAYGTDGNATEVFSRSLSDQKLIADYLNKETAKIDELIQAKKRLLELLDEQRFTLINQAITRGLNPDIPMRDSGTKWIGKIPKHWDFLRLRWCILTLQQGWSPKADEKEPEEQEWAVLRLNAVQRGEFDESKAKTIPVSLKIPTALEIHPGDFLITRANTPKLVGNACYVQKIRPRLIFSDLIYRLRLDQSKLDGQFLSFFFQTDISRYQIEADARGSIPSMVKISKGHILNWLLLLPPLKEQKSIVDYIETKLSQIKALKTATEDTIKFLKERRSGLITAALNGELEIKE
ncbi:restriction endonuclease subunit S [Planktothrix paucivesiculata]|uniref:Restriction endonuclease S subunit n=1 Tax=Planktothrix paucivesiculata PCC 9631 TaxID=671071 RepID=A0A7Z9BXL9_9CYAN